MAKKKNPQDATLRNIRALKKRVLALEQVQAVILRRLEHRTKRLGGIGR